jgi:hypothetical protein
MRVSIVVAIVAASMLVALSGCTTSSDSPKPQGIILHSPDQGNETLLTVRELIQDMGWQVTDETRDSTDSGGNITIEAVDSTGAGVTFIDFWTKDGTAGLLVRTEAEAQYTPILITTEIARRLGLSDAEPLIGE